MNINLFPVAAFLLLLSGLGAPAHSAGQAGNSAALMRAMLGRWDANQTGTTAAVLSRGAARRQVAQWDAQVAWNMSSARGLWSGVHVPLLTSSCRAFDRKQYKTRFGLVAGAYLATAPPASGRRNGLDWLRS